MKKRSAALFGFLFLSVCSSCSAAGHVRNGSPIALPEARVTLPQGRHREVKNHHTAVQHPDLVGEAVTSVRGGASASTTMQAIYGIAAMAMVEASLKKFFTAANINFPSQLGGCIFLFVVAVLAQVIRPGWGDAIQDFLDPGCALLSKWLPSFFVPGLAMLPLAPSIGSGMDVRSLHGFVTQCSA